MSAATDSPLGSLPQPPSRAPLRTSSSRTSLGPGVFSPMSSPKSLQRPAGPSPSSSFARLSGTGASSSNSPSNGLGPAPPSGGLSLPGGAGGDLPRLTRASESGVVERNSRNSPSTPGGSLRRSTTISGGARESGGPASLGVTMAAKDGSPSPSGGGPGPGPGGHESAFVVKRERNALLQEKALLLANKRRMDAAIRSLLEQQAEDGTTWAGDGGSAAGGSGGGGGGGGGSPMPAMGGPRPPLTRAAGSVRNLMAKVLEDSANLDKQIAVNGSSGAAILANAEADARVRELTARISELQTEHEVALSRLEGELKYRNTQSSAATSGLQKQLGEAEEEVARLRRQLSLAEGRVREYATSNTELRRQLFELNTTLGDRNQALADAKTAMGTDKATLQTVNDMLKAQLREATADRASKASRIAELERQLVHRETLLAEAQQQLDAARGGHTGGHINGHTHSSISGAAPSGLLGGGSKSSSIPGGLSLGLSSSVSLPIGTMSSVFYSTGGLGGGGGGAGGGGGGTGNGMGAPTRLTPLPPPEPKDIWGSVSPVLTAGGARSHVPVAGGLNGPNGLNGGAANGQAAAPVVPGLVMVNGFIKAGGGGATGSTGSAIASQFGRGPAAGRGALTPQAIEAAQSLGLSSAYSEDFSGSEPDDAEDRD